MKIKSIAKLLLAAAIMQVAVACGGSKPVIDPQARLAYEQNASQENLVNLTKAYASYINKCRKTGDSEPGVYSEYAVLLLKSGGSRAEANSWFNKEMERYPSSRGYVMELLIYLIDVIRQTLRSLSYSVHIHTVGTCADDTTESSRTKL